MIDDDAVDTSFLCLANGWRRQGLRIGQDIGVPLGVCGDIFENTAQDIAPGSVADFYSNENLFHRKEL